MESKRRKRSLRVALVLGAALAGTALVGFGGLAAWQAYTQNNGNSFSAGTLVHTNSANGSTACTSSATVTSCDLVVSGSLLTSSWTGTSGNVVITNTGTLSSNFAMLMPSAPSGALCADLTLTVSDNESPAATVYPVTSLASAMGSTSLKDSAGNALWPTNSGGAAGTNTFTFNVNTGAAYQNDNSAPGSSCTFAVEFDQSA